MRSFLGSLFFLVLAKPEENKTFRNYALLFTALLLFPFTAFLLIKYRTDYYNYASLLSLLPVTAVTAAGLTEAAGVLLSRIRTRKGKSRYLNLCAVFGALFLLTALCGTVSLSHTDMEESRGFEKTGAGEQEVLAFLSDKNKTGEWYIWAPDAVVETARAFDGSLKLVYGRDMWNNALSGYTDDVYGEDKRALYAWMNTNWIEVQAYSLETDFSPKEAFELAAACGCNLVVLTKEQVQVPQIKSFLEEENPKTSLLTKISETIDYEIFELKR